MEGEEGGAGRRRAGGWQERVAGRGRAVGGRKG